MARHAICDLKIFNFSKYFMSSLLAVPGLHCCMWAFSSCGKQRALSSWDARAPPVAELGLQSARASVVAVPGLRTVVGRLSCPAACEISVPRPGTEPVSPALEGRLPTTGTSGMSQDFLYHLLRGLPLPPSLKQPSSPIQYLSSQPALSCWHSSLSDIDSIYSCLFSHILTHQGRKLSVLFTVAPVMSGRGPGTPVSINMLNK